MNKRVLWIAFVSMSSLTANDIHLNVGPLFNFARFKVGDLPKVQGYLTGIHTDFEFVTAHYIYTRLIFDGRWNAGFVCGDQDTKAQIKDYRPQWWLGYQWCSCDAFFFTPFTGFGFYYLSNELKPDVIQYRYFNIFVPLGLTFEWSVRPPQDFTMGIRGWYRPDVWTRAKVETASVQICKVKKIKLRRSHGVHVEVPMSRSWRCGEYVDLYTNLVPFFDWNRFGNADEANSNGLCLEVPHIDCWYLGLHIDISIRF
jgi:hypothetical protein